MGRPAIPVTLVILLAFAAAVPSSAQVRSATKTSPVAFSNSSEIESQAQSAADHGDFEKAARLYSQMVKASPHSASLQFRLGAANYSAGHPAEAMHPLEEALRLNPKLAEARYFLAASLAESGRCSEAVPDLRQAVRHIHNRHLQLNWGIDGVNCSMNLDRQDDALAFLQELQHRFPKNAQVLYLSVHVFSDLSTRASQKLLVADPGSYEVHELNAEALAAQGKWDQAESEYRKVLAMKPDLPGIHYLIGRLILTKPKTATTFAKAKKEFEKELRVNPHNAGAEFVLGELALHSEDYNTAIARFSKAAEDDPNFANAKIELGRSLISLHQPAKAITPLESAVKLQPQNPSAHYLLAMAYRGAGRMQDAQKQLVEYQKATNNDRKTNQNIQSGILGRKAPSQMPENSAAPQH